MAERKLVGDLLGQGRVICGGSTFKGVPYRISVWSWGRRGRQVLAVIDRTDAIANDDVGHIELAGGQGWFDFKVTDPDRGEIEILGLVNG